MCLRTNRAKPYGHGFAGQANVGWTLRAGNKEENTKYGIIERAPRTARRPWRA